MRRSPGGSNNRQADRGEGASFHGGWRRICSAARAFRGACVPWPHFGGGVFVPRQDYSDGRIGGGCGASVPRRNCSAAHPFLRPRGAFVPRRGCSQGRVDGTCGTSVPRRIGSPTCLAAGDGGASVPRCSASAARSPASARLFRASPEGRQAGAAADLFPVSLPVRRSMAARPLRRDRDVSACIRGKVEDFLNYTKFGRVRQVSCT